MRLSLLLCAVVAAGATVAGACQPEPIAPTSAQTTAAVASPAIEPPSLVTPTRPSNEAIRAELEAAHGGAPKVDLGAEGGAEATDGGASVGMADGGGTAAAGGGTTPGAVTGDADVARRDFDTKSRDRLARIDARARELEQKAGKLTGTKRTTFDSGLRRFAADREDAGKKLDTLGRNADWKTVKGSIERSLDGLESALTRLDDNL